MQIPRIAYLVLQELRSASRTRYIILTFILMPLLMWGFQAGIQVFIGSSFTGEGETIWVSNQDIGNATINGESVNLGKLFVDKLENATHYNTTLLHKVNIKEISLNEGVKLRDDGTISIWIIIPQNFSSSYENNNLTNFEFWYKPGAVSVTILQAGIEEVTYSPPLTKINVNIEKQCYYNSQKIVYEGKKEFSFGIGFLSFISIIIAVMAPAPFVSTSFAGEREKKTLEALIALPIPRFQILLGKLLAGFVLILLFTGMNIVGMMSFLWIMAEFSTVFDETGNSSEPPFGEVDAVALGVIALAMFLTAFIAIGIGISIASLTKDVRSAESLYSISMLIPSMVIGMIGMTSGLPEELGSEGWFLYLIPWSHTLALVNKILFFPAEPWEFVFHIGFLLGFIFIILVIAAKVFEREGII